MNIVAIVLVVGGAAAFLASVQLVGHANPGRRLPYFGRAAVVPARAIALRALGGGLAVLAAALLAPTVGYWSVAIVTVALLPGIVLIPVHNRAVAAR